MLSRDYRQFVILISGLVCYWWILQIFFSKTFWKLKLSLTKNFCKMFEKYLWRNAFLRKCFLLQVSLPEISELHYLGRVFSTVYILILEQLLDPKSLFFFFSQSVTNPLFPDHAKAPTFQIMSWLLRNKRFDIPLTKMP